MNLYTQFWRCKLILRWLVCVFLLSMVMALPVQAGSAPTVRVLLLEKQTTVRIKGSMEIQGYRSPQPFTGEKLFTSTDLNLPVTIVAQSGLLMVNGNSYRGEIVVKPTPEGLMVINRLSLEEYLYGVLPGEVDPAWPVDALKAQAVAARSYALTQMRWRVSQDYDLYDDQRSQVYYGARKENTRTTEAVNATRGLVARYEGEVIQANFFAAGGGQTANSEDVWGKALPYLRSVPDYDQGSPHYTWAASMAVEDIQARLEAAGICLGRLLDLVPLERDSSNRVKTLKVIGERSEVLLSGSAFRFLLGLKSTNFTFVHSNTTIDEERASGEATSAEEIIKDGVEPAGIAPNDADASTASGFDVHTQIGSVLDGQTASFPGEAENMQTIETRPVGELINSIFEQAEVESQCVTQDTASSSLALLISEIFSYYANLPGPMVGRVEFTGSGWGHGVGLSQWGARAMAANGASFQQILTHYYQGVEIFQLYK